MKRTHTITVAVLMLWMPGQLLAGVFSRDWKTPGDGLLTYDDVNQREWLDIPVSLMTQFSGATLEARFQDAILELQPGGQFDGFTLASQNDVLALAESAGVDTSTTDLITNYTATAALLDLLGHTTEGLGSLTAVGLLNDVVAPPPAKCPCQLGVIIGVGSPNYAGLRFLSTAEIIADDGGISVTGLFLYRQIPEPAPPLLAALGLFALSWLIRFR